MQIQLLTNLFIFSDVSQKRLTVERYLTFLPDVYFYCSYLCNIYKLL